MEKYIVNVVRNIPEQDLKGLERINIYDDSFPKAQTGLYYPPDVISKGAQIDIYLDQALGYMVWVRGKMGIVSQIANRVFLLSFGKLFLAESLLHEIGHHKHDTILKKQYNTNAEQEEDAENYFLTYYRKIYPFMSKYYGMVNAIYRLLFKRRIQMCNRLISERSAYDPEYFFRNAMAHLKEEDYGKALEELNKVIALDPTNHYAYSNRARAKYGLGKYEEAIQDMTQAISLNPNYLAEAYYYRGWYYQSVNAWDKAIDDYKNAIELGCSDEGIYLDKAYCHVELRDYENAKGALYEAIKRGLDESEIPEDLKEIMRT